MYRNFLSRVEELSKKLGLEGVSCDVGAVDWLPKIPDSECVLIKSENLTALIGLIESGLKIDVCYIDPPYNTGSKFIYDDKRSSASLGFWGKHNDWLAFMLPRLVAAQMMLKEAGVFMVSIDDYEYPYLKIIMDHVFGEKNYIATLVLCRSKNGKGGKANVAVNHEYIVVYGRSPSSKLYGLLEVDLEKYQKSDAHGLYTVDGLFRKKGDASRRQDRPNMFYPLYCAPDGQVFVTNDGRDLKEVWPVDSKGIERRWLWGRDKAQAESWRLYASPNGVVYVKNYMSEGKRRKIRSILDDSKYLNDRAAVEIKSIYGDRLFETPKPVGLIRDLIDFSSGEDALILDFFAGTGTTAHASCILNVEEGARRRCILVEHKQMIDAGHSAAQHGYLTTADITEARLKYVGDKYPGFEYSVIDPS